MCSRMAYMVIKASLFVDYNASPARSRLHKLAPRNSLAQQLKIATMAAVAKEKRDVEAVVKLAWLGDGWPPPITTPR